MARKDEHEPVITFGTDGWRGIIGDSFTVKGVRVVAQAFADWLNGSRPRSRKVLVGYDGRFGGEMFAKAAGRVLTGNGLYCEVTAGPVPTPAVSWWILNRKYAGGLMITASHNPPAYSGVKIKPSYGGSPDDAIIQPIFGNLWKRAPKEGHDACRVEIMPGYRCAVGSYTDLKAIARMKGRVVFDPMGGAQAGQMGLVLKGRGPRLIEMHGRVDPMFCGLASPEPVRKNLLGLEAAVKRERAMLGIGTDGDGDRVAIVDERGDFLTPHKVLALLVLYMVRYRGETGAMVKTVSGSFLLDRIARKHGLKMFETPVGFKHVCRLMREHDIMIGGEESGGIGFRGYLPERDGLLAGLLFLELMAKSGKSCGRLVAELERDFGVSRYGRIDVRTEKAQSALARLRASPPGSVAGTKVAKVNAADGLKLVLPDDSWLLFRASGTEPLLRIYAESDNEGRTQKLLKAGAKLAGVRG